VAWPLYEPKASDVRLDPVPGAFVRTVAGVSGNGAQPGSVLLSPWWTGGLISVHC
jgi:hypothetical protein